MQNQMQYRYRVSGRAVTVTGRVQIRSDQIRSDQIRSDQIRLG